MSKFPDKKLGVVYPAIADGWQWSIIYNAPNEIALIWNPEGVCKAKVIDGVKTMNPASDEWDSNIVDQIIKSNLSYK